MTGKHAKRVGQQLQAVRFRKGMTQTEVAKAAGTNANYYAKLERGEAIPSLNMLSKVAKALGIHSKDLDLF